MFINIRMSLNQKDKKSKPLFFKKAIFWFLWGFTIILLIFLLKRLIYYFNDSNVSKEQGIYFDFNTQYVLSDFLPPEKTENVQNYEVLASKSGSRYYFPNCSGVNRIKKENLVYFKSVKDAELKGLTLAKNCSK
jgi:hypothetical protein